MLSALLRPDNLLMILQFSWDGRAVNYAAIDKGSLGKIFHGCLLDIKRSPAFSESRDYPAHLRTTPQKRFHF